MARTPRVCLFGAAGDTQNLGVSALQEATVQGLRQRLPDADVTVFDHGRGRRPATVADDAAQERLHLVGARASRRVHQPESWTRIRVELALPRSRNPAVQAIRSADAILDASGGDSFSDIYGMARLRAVTAPKTAALSQGVPLLLLPQTYGPFADARARRQAAAIVRGADRAWARDADSFDQLRSLVGDAFDPERHRSGVDVAFALEPEEPSAGWSEPLRGWLEEDRDRPVVGLNASGLVYFAHDAASRFGIALDYPSLLRRFLDRLLAETDARVVLVPHVLGRGGTESDENAADALRAGSGRSGARVLVAPSFASAAQAKALIGRFDWFCGMRMHSCIAALSSGVPTAGLAYSPKTRGVFGSVGQSAQVIDARAEGTDEALHRLWSAWEARDVVARDLRAALPGIRAEAARQSDDIAARIATLARRSEP